jgi:hypothetical protein
MILSHLLFGAHRSLGVDQGGAPVFFATASDSMVKSSQPRAFQAPAEEKGRRGACQELCLDTTGPDRGTPVRRAAGGGHSHLANTEVLAQAGPCWPVPPLPAG